MRLNKIEFMAMNNPLRRWIQKNCEFKAFKNHIKKCNFDLKGKAILDIGCGSGYSTKLLQEEFLPSRLVAFDYMPEQIEIAQKRNLDAEFFAGDAANINISSETFDTVFVFGVLHHIPEWEKALQEIFRVLNKGGILLIEEPTTSLISLANALGFKHPPEAAKVCKNLKSVMKHVGFKILAETKICFSLAESLLCIKR